MSCSYANIQIDNQLHKFELVSGITSQTGDYLPIIKHYEGWFKFDSTGIMEVEKVSLEDVQQCELFLFTHCSNNANNYDLSDSE